MGTEYMGDKGAAPAVYAGRGDRGAGGGGVCGRLKTSGRMGGALLTK